MSYIEKLVKKIDNIGIIINHMLDNSSIYYHNTKVLGRSPYHWNKKDERNQIKAKEKYLEFIHNFNLLIEKANPNTKRKIKDANDWIINLIEQNKAPTSIEKGKKHFITQTQVFKDYLNLLDNDTNKTIIIPDTNSIIQFPEPKNYSSISPSEKFEFIILPTILSELDKHKMTHRNDDFRKKVTSVIKRLKGYRKQGQILEGVIVNKTITVKMVATEPNFEKTLNWLDANNNDDRIIANALELQIANPGDNIIFITSDINLQNKAELANLTVYDTDELK